MHERGAYIALYGFFLIGSNFLANVFAGFINTGQGWKWVLVREPGETCFDLELILPVLVCDTHWS